MPLQCSQIQTCGTSIFERTVWARRFWPRPLAWPINFGTWHAASQRLVVLFPRGDTPFPRPPLRGKNGALRYSEVKDVLSFLGARQWIESIRVGEGMEGGILDGVDNHRKSISNNVTASLFSVWVCLCNTGCWCWMHSVFCVFCDKQVGDGVPSFDIETICASIPLIF